MSQRASILIVENDDFLRELLGNLLHKEGYFIMNGSTVARGVDEVNGRKVDTVILGSSCSDFKEKSTVSFLNKSLNNPRILFVNTLGKKVPYLNENEQFLQEDLSAQEIISRVIAG